jgi:hypothetical protein
MPQRTEPVKLAKRAGVMPAARKELNDLTADHSGESTGISSGLRMTTLPSSQIATDCPNCL